MPNNNNTLETSTLPDRRAYGRRKLDLESIGWRARSQAEFKGLPHGVTAHHALLDTFKAAAPALGLSRDLVELMDKLFSYTSPQDWQGGVGPSSGHPISRSPKTSTAHRAPSRPRSRPCSARASW